MPSEIPIESQHPVGDAATAYTVVGDVVGDTVRKLEGVQNERKRGRVGKTGKEHNKSQDEYIYTKRHQSTTVVLRVPVISASRTLGTGGGTQAFQAPRYPGDWQDSVQPPSNTKTCITMYKLRVYCVFCVLYGSHVLGPGGTSTWDRCPVDFKAFQAPQIPWGADGTQ